MTLRDVARRSGKSSSPGEPGTNSSVRQEQAWRIPPSAARSRVAEVVVTGEDQVDGRGRCRPGGAVSLEGASGPSGQGLVGQDDQAAFGGRRAPHGLLGKRLS